MKDNQKEKMYSMFYPKNVKTFKTDYPELLKNQKYSGLSNNEMLFVWYFACEASPFSKEDNDKVRCEMSVNEAFGRKAEELMSVYLNGNYKEEVRGAINEMKSYRIGPRVRSKLMIEKIMANYEKMVDIDPSKEFINEDSDGTDWSKKKAYIDACANISKTLPNLISQAEGGFGVSEKEAGKEIEIDSASLIDKFQQMQND